MQKKLATDPMHTNQEYVKLRGQRPDDDTPRESSDHQSSGGRGLQRLGAWTTSELREIAEGAHIEHADGMDRDELIDALVLAQVRRQARRHAV
jgi:hypothetical protein